MATTNDYEALHDLSDQQRIAIDALVAGATHREAAEAAGVHRVTVSNWTSKHPGFQAELNKRRLEIADERKDRIRQMDMLALEAVNKGLEDGDPAVALGWLKLRRLGATNVDAVGPTDSEQIIEREAARRLEAARLRASQDVFDHVSVGVDLDGMRKRIEEERASELESEGSS